MIQPQDLPSAFRPVRNFWLGSLVVPAILAGCANAASARDPVRPC